MDFTLSNYKCSLCKREETKLLFKKQGFSIVECSHCGFVYVNPRVCNEQLSVIYQHSYFKNKDYGYVSYEQEKNLRIKNFKRWLKDTESYLSTGKPIQALDVGCAAGYCLDVMKTKGWNAEGIELDEEMCDNLQQQGYVVSETALQNFNPVNKYGIITLFDVIEHIPDIDIAFRQLRSLLSNDGIVVMVTPDYGSFQRKIFGRRWFQYKPVEHIQYFTKQTLETFALRNGLKMVCYKNCGQYADAEFIVNRLKYYHFNFLSSFFDKLFTLFKLKNKFLYTDTGSLFVIFKNV